MTVKDGLVADQLFTTRDSIIGRNELVIYRYFVKWLSIFSAYIVLETDFGSFILTKYASKVISRNKNVPCFLRRSTYPDILQF